MAEEVSAGSAGDRLDADFAVLLEHPQFLEGEDWVRRSLAAGETVFREGDPGQELYVVLAGTVRVIGQVEIGDERRVHPGMCDLAAGSFFGELALFDGEARSARVETLADTELAVINGERLLAFFDVHPEIGYRFLRQVMSTLVARLRRTNRKVESLLAWGLRAHQIDSHL